MDKLTLSNLAKTHTSVRMRLRCLAILHFQDGHSRTDIAKFLKVSRTSVNKWVSQYLQFGIDSFIDKKPPGRPSKLSIAQQQQIRDYVKSKENNDQGGRLNGQDVQAYIQKNFDITFHISHVYRLLHKLGFSWITSRSKHPKQSVEAQEEFKKIPNKNDP